MALKAELTRELELYVPGTGETRTSRTLKLHALLANGAKRGVGEEENSPILLVCTDSGVPAMLEGQQPATSATAATQLAERSAPW